MLRFATATIALGWTALSAHHVDATPARGAREPAANVALIVNCYKMAERIVPRVRGRSAWVVRHADHCVRSGGSL
jgi:hypothetical protein